MTVSRKIIKAFIASAGDLQAEREAVKEVTNQFNKDWADHFGVAIELIGWEDTIAGIGRPQELINQDLDKCELFIGMMWRRWGTPPSLESEYSSGFEEEYQRSVIRHKSSGEPEICLHFKEISDDHLTDPGEDLKKVIEFRQSIVDGKQILFKQFSDLNDLSDQIRSLFSRYLTRLAQKAISLEKEDKGGTKLQNKSHLVNASGHSPSPLSNEGLQFLNELLDDLGDTSRERELSPIEIARFRLLSNIFSSSENDDRYLGVHDLNLIYENKNERSLGSAEVSTLIRFGLGALLNENTPLWHWFSKRKNNFLTQYLSVFDENDEVRCGSIILMNWLGLDIRTTDTWSRDQVISAWFSNSSTANLRQAAIEYLANNGDLSDIETLKQEFDRGDKNTSRKALEGMIQLFIRFGDKLEAAELIISCQFEHIKPNLLQLGTQGLNALPINSLRIGLTHTNPKVRLESIKCLSNTNSLNNNDLELLCKDENSDVRYQAVQLRIQRGSRFSDSEIRNILVKSTDGETRAGLMGLRLTDSGEANYKNYKLNELTDLKQTELTEIHEKSHLFEDDAYFTLSERYFSSQSDQLRKNIDDRFKEYFELKHQKFRALAGPQVPTDITSKVRSIETQTRKNLTRRGLNILCKKMAKTDLGRIRRNLDEEYSGASIFDAKFLKRFGQFSDIETLAKSQKSLFNDDSDGYHEFYEAIAEMAATLGRDNPNSLFSLNLPTNIMTALLRQVSQTCFNKASDEALAHLFASNESLVRKVTALRVISGFTKKKISKILEQYLSLDNRFYNVIHWLDLGAAMTKSDIKKIVNTATNI